MFVLADHWPSACPTHLVLQGPGEGPLPWCSFPGKPAFIKLLNANFHLLLCATVSCSILSTAVLLLIHLQFHEAIKLSFLSFMFPNSSKTTAGILMLVDQLKTGSHFSPNLEWRPMKPLNRCGSFQNVQFTQKSTEIKLILYR